MQNIGSVWIWVGFCLFIVIALGIDAFVEKKHGGGPQLSIRTSLYWSLAWVFCALLFNGLLWGYLASTVDIVFAKQKALDFFAGYLIEKSLLSRC